MLLRKMAQTISRPASPAITYARITANPFPSNLFPTLSTPPLFLCQSIRGIKVKTFDIPDDKRLEFGLQKIHGIGRSKARQILCELSIENKPAKDMTALERFTLGEEIFEHLIDRGMRQYNAKAVQRLQQIQCYRGTRHAKKLPCRGQRTHTNANTVKSKRERLAKQKPDKKNKNTEKQKTKANSNDKSSKQSGGGGGGKKKMDFVK